MTYEPELIERLKRIGSCTTGLRIDGTYAAARVLDVVRQYDAEHDLDDIAVFGKPKRQHRIKTRVGTVRKGEPVIYAEDFEE